MNIAKIFNAVIAAMLFAVILAVTLPGFFSPDMSPFQAFVVAPALTLLAAMVSAGLHHALELGERRLHQAHLPCLKRTDGDRTGSMQISSSRRAGRRGSKASGVSQDTGHGQRAA